MARHRFQHGQEVAGRLDEVFVRPIENGPKSGVTLLRLEFAVYSIQARNRELLPSDARACREIVVGPSIDATRDSSLMAYAHALGVSGDPRKPERWLALKGLNRWIRITFGALKPPDDRNPFDKFAAFDVDGYEIRLPAHPEPPPWATVKQVAHALKISEASVRRMTDALESDWGTDLVRRTDGGHRRINLKQLKTIRSDD
jgi:hypothetical protein